jgi:ribosomal protein S18 acetylase RimI-like enzyme
VANKVMNGVAVQPLHGAPFRLCVLEEGVAISSLLFVLRPTPEKDVNAAVIVSIWTHPDRVRKGHAKELIEKLKQFMGGSIDWIAVDPEYDTEEGNSFFNSIGFLKNERGFTWRRIIKTPKLKLATPTQISDAIRDLQSGNN